MGAYDNPKIIQQPDYGQIFSRNFQAGLSQQQAIKDRAEKRREKEKMQDQRLADRELAFATSIGKIEAGDLTASLQRLGFSEADSYSENERLWADNKISRDEYSKNRSNSFRKIQELAQIGKSLELQSKNFETLDESKFQNDPRSIGLIEAWKEKKMQFQYVGNEVEIYYNDGKKNVMVDIDDLKNNDFFNINQRVELEDSEYVNLAKTAGVKVKTFTDTNFDTAGNSTKTIEKKYEQTEEAYISKIANSGKMAKLFSDEKQAGSLFVDTVHSILKGSNRLAAEADELIKKHDIKDPDFKKAFINNIAYNNPDYRDALDELSKKVLAEEAFNNHLPQNQRIFNAGGVSSEQAKPESSGIESEFKNKNLVKYFKDVDNINFNNTKGVGPTIDGKPMVDFNELEPILSKPPYNLNVKNPVQVGARQTRQFTKTVKGADRTVTVFDNATPEDIRKAIKYLETGENYNFSTNVSIPGLPIYN